MFKQKVNLEEYLPVYIAEYREMSSLLLSENRELEYLWQVIDDSYHNQFISTAKEEGIKRYENIFSVIKKDDENLEDRRFNLSARKKEDIPYTYLSLLKKLGELCGKDMYEVNIDYGKYLLEVKLGLSVKRQFEAVEDLLKRIVPANMETKIVIMFNSNLKASKLKHIELMDMTHYEIRNKEDL